MTMGLPPSRARRMLFGESAGICSMFIEFLGVMASNRRFLISSTFMYLDLFAVLRKVFSKASLLPPVAIPLFI